MRWNDWSEVRRGSRPLWAAARRLLKPLKTNALLHRIFQRSARRRSRRWTDTAHLLRADLRRQSCRSHAIAVASASPGRVQFQSLTMKLSGDSNRCTTTNTQQGSFWKPAESPSDLVILLSAGLPRPTRKRRASASESQPNRSLHRPQARLRLFSTRRGATIKIVSGCGQAGFAPRCATLTPDKEHNNLFFPTKNNQSSFLKQRQRWRIRSAKLHSKTRTPSRLCQPLSTTNRGRPFVRPRGRSLTRRASAFCWKNLPSGPSLLPYPYRKPCPT